ncbi:MAG: hypothetical protein Q8N55_01850, partial [bacterium]|nr:hypothetical protein [bacterium]
SQATIELAQEGFATPQNVLSFAQQIKAKAQYANQAFLSFSEISTKGAFSSIKKDGQGIKTISLGTQTLSSQASDFSLGLINEPSKKISEFFEQLAQGTQGIALSLKESATNIAKKAVYYVEQTEQIPQYLKESFVFTKDFFVGSFQILKYNVEQETIKEQKEQAQRQQEKDFALLKQKIKDTSKEKTSQLAEGFFGVTAEVSGKSGKGVRNLLGFIGGFFDVVEGIANNIKDNVVEGARFVLSPWIRDDEQQNFFVTYENENPPLPPLKEEVVYQPIKQVETIKQVFTIDNTRLALLEENNTKLQNQIDSWQTDITNLRDLFEKLQARPPGSPTYVNTSPVYISSPGFEVTGNAVFSDLSVSGLA